MKWPDNIQLQTCLNNIPRVTSDYKNKGNYATV